VGGVSGRPTRNRKGAILSRISRRNGERHPDPRDAGSLRGMSEKRGSRPVRTRAQQVSSSVIGRTGDNGCPLESRRRGTSSACARRTHSARRPRSPRSRTRPSLGPETRARHATHVARQFRYRGRANSREREETGTEVEAVGRMRGSPRVTALQSRGQLRTRRGRA